MIDDDLMGGIGARGHVHYLPKTPLNGTRTGVIFPVQQNKIYD
jgi:hypothetical protein